MTRKTRHPTEDAVKPSPGRTVPRSGCLPRTDRNENGTQALAPTKGPRKNNLNKLGGTP